VGVVGRCGGSVWWVGVPKLSDERANIPLPTLTVDGFHREDKTDPFFDRGNVAVIVSCLPASCTWTPAKDVVTAASFAFRANCVFAHVCVAISVGCPIVNSIFPVPMFTVSVIV